MQLHIQNATIHLSPSHALEVHGIGERFMIGAAQPIAGDVGHSEACAAGCAARRSDTEVLRASALTPPAPGERWAGQGGFYGGTWPAMAGLPARHLVFSEDEREAMKFGGYGEDMTGATSRSDGRSNTAALLASKDLHPAAEWCAAHRAEGHADFHLPSQADLFMAMLCAPHRFEKSGWYWSSTQISRHSAFVQDFEYGGSNWYGKDLEFRVRAVRWIHFNA